MDRFTRFKILRGIWARAKHLLACLHGPRAREDRLRAYWQQVNVAERNLRDGVIRGVGDPDSAIRPFLSDQAWRAQREAHQRQAYESWHRQHRQGR